MIVEDRRARWSLGLIAAVCVRCGWSVPVNAACKHDGTPPR